MDVDERVRAHAPSDAGEHETLRRAMEIPEEARLWGVGEALAFVPRLANTVFGDGRALFWFTTIRDRPAYWVVRGDSSWVVVNRCSPPDLPDDVDVIDMVMDALKDQFGDGGEDGDEEGGVPFPAVDDTMGRAWDRMRWPVATTPDRATGEVVGTAG